MDVSLPFLIRAEMSPIRQDSGRALSGSSPSTIRVPGQIQPIRGKRSDTVARAGRRRRATCWSDRFVIPVTTGVIVPGRVGPGLDRAMLIFPGERGRFACWIEEGSGRLVLAGRLDLSSSEEFQTAPTVSPLT
jgi:hypothetical protein